MDRLCQTRLIPRSPDGDKNIFIQLENPRIAHSYVTHICVPANKFVPHNDYLFPRAVFLSSLVFTILNNSPSMILYFRFFYAVLQYICCIENHYNLQNIFHVSAHLPLDTSLPQPSFTKCQACLFHQHWQPHP